MDNVGIFKTLNNKDKAWYMVHFFGYVILPFIFMISFLILIVEIMNVNNYKIEYVFKIIIPTIIFIILVGIGYWAMLKYFDSKYSYEVKYLTLKNNIEKKVVDEIKKYLKSEFKEKGDLINEYFENEFKEKIEDIKTNEVLSYREKELEFLIEEKEKYSILKENNTLTPISIILSCLGAISAIILKIIQDTTTDKTEGMTLPSDAQVWLALMCIIFICIAIGIFGNLKTNINYCIKINYLDKREKEIEKIIDEFKKKKPEKNQTNEDQVTKEENQKVIDVLNEIKELLENKKNNNSLSKGIFKKLFG